MVEDLAASGLSATDLKARRLGPSEKAATASPLGAEGYVIPYFDIRGNVVPFYRAKLFDQPAHEAKYRQIIGTPNHVYFPPRLYELLDKLQDEDSLQFIILTEGEKKAAAAVKEGFPCAAVSGVDSWRNRIVSLPKDIKLAAQPNGSLRAKLPAGSNTSELSSTLAHGMDELIDLALKHKIPIILCFDSDGPEVKEPVQRAIAALGYELRFRGIAVSCIRQLTLPNESGGKVGLDDFLKDRGTSALSGIIQECLSLKSAFPRYPNIRNYIGSKLSRPSLGRQELQSISLAIISDLDARGQRLRAPDEDQLYYFSNDTRKLLKATFYNDPQQADTPFGIKLYQDYGITYADNRINPWLASQFSAEDPVQDVRPERVLCWKGDTFYFQINDGQTARVTSKGIDILNNGDDGVLFEAGMVEEVRETDLVKILKVQMGAPLSNRWYEVLKEARIRDTAEDHQRKLLSLLYYVSPYFYRWRGTQLPIEITTGEAGSGKSSLYVLRLNILTGDPSLKNAPPDMKDWNASLARTGAMHVTDNVQLTDNTLRQKLSDEMCRLVTEPNPSIEQRKLYTDSTVVKIRVKAVFAVTAIKQPFSNVDIIQRSIVTDLDKGTSSNLEYDSRWPEHQMERFGGRVNWVAHHLIFVHRFLRDILPQNVGQKGETEGVWKSRYQAKYRLINVEQLLLCAAQTLGEDHDWIRRYLEVSRDTRINEADWALEGLKAWADEQRETFGPAIESELFSTADIANWIQGEEEFCGCRVLAEGRSLGRYLIGNKHTVASTTGIEPGPNRQNKQYYKIRPN
jgi:hypothetical protein